MSIGGAITSGTANSVLFVGAGSVLAQDPTKFAWDDTNFDLTVGRKYRTILNSVTVDALFGVYNASSDNWFVGEAGNTTTTGNANLGIGPAAVGSVTSGYHNFGMGASALGNVSTGFRNIGIGVFALVALTTGQDNFALGEGALHSATSDSRNIAIGNSALFAQTGGGGDSNVAIGGSALSNINSLTNATGNVGVGGTVLGNLTAGSTNTAVGNSAGVSITSGSNNTLLGCWHGPSGAMSGVIALSDGAGNLLGDYNYTNSSSWTFKGNSNVAYFTSSSTTATIMYLQNTSSGGYTFSFFTGGSLNFPGHFGVYDNTTSSVWFDIDAVHNGKLAAVSGGVWGWSSSATNASVAPDTGLSRTAAGVIAAGNGTAGNTSGTFIANLYQVPLNAVATNALFGVYNASDGNSWFFGNSGNLTLTRGNNIGIGDGAASSITSGHDNVCISNSAGTAILSGQGNVLIGVNAGKRIDVGSGNFALGANALAHVTGSANCVSIGANSLVNATDGGNVAIGASAGNVLTTGGGLNTFVGTSSGSAITTGANNTLLGNWPGPSGAMSNVIALSDGAGTLRADYGYSTSGVWSFQNSGWTMTLPTNAGTSGYMLQTNGAGVTSWVAPGTASVAIGSAVTGGTANSVLYLAAGGLLAQDNAALSWTDSTKTLLAGTMFQQLVNSVATNALFGVYNASANNWFVGNSGNTSTTGSNNIGLGDAAVGVVTSGKDNIGIGYGAAGAVTTGIRNIGLGYQSLFAVATGSNNVALGAFAGNTINGSTNMCIGYSSLGSATGPGTNNNVSIGGNSLAAVTGSTSGNTAIGGFAGSNITSGNNNTLIGAWGGPSGAMSSVIALSDGAGNLRLDYQYSAVNYWTFAAQVRSTINGAFNVDIGGVNQGCFSVYNGATLLGMMRGDGNVAGTQVETIDDATAAISQAAGLPPIGMKMFSGGCISWTNNVHWWDTSDTTMSRNAAGIVQVGTGTTGNALGTLFASVFGGPGGLANAAPILPSINTAFTGSASGAALTSISNATPAVFTLTGHGLFGGQPILLTTTGTLPSPLATLTTYYVDNATLGANAFEVSTTYGGAVVNTTTAGSGTHSFAPGGVVTILIGANSTVTLTNHGMVPGQAFKFATSGALPTGITAGTTYYVLNSAWTINAFRYSATPNGPTITTSGTQSGTQTITLDSATANQPNAALNIGASAILGGQIAAGYKFTQYWNTTGTPLGALIVNAVNINSAVGGKILDLQVGGNSVFNVQTASTGTTIVPSAPFNLSPGGTKRLDFGNTIANAWAFFAEVALIAGTTSVPPLVFQSGTNLTTAAAGACEFDGTCFYETALASSRQVVNTEQTQNLSATRTFTNNTSAQAIFNATANGAVTLGIGTYEFEMLVDATGFSASAHTLNLGFAGTATYTMTYYFDAQAVGSATPTSSATGFIATATATAIIASATTTGLLLYCRGTVRCTAGGTFIPQLTQVTASAAAVVAAGSFVRLWPIGSATVTSVGNWS